VTYGVTFDLSRAACVMRLYDGERAVTTIVVVRQRLRTSASGGMTFGDSAIGSSSVEPQK
jgi:hypothetical protein